MILSIIIAIVLVIATVAYFMTKDAFDFMHVEVNESLTTIPDAIDADLDILRLFNIID